MNQTVIRNEINTRLAFAKQEAEKAFEGIKNVQKSGGNVTTCKSAKRFVKAFKIQEHYHKEFTNYINSDRV